MSAKRLLPVVLAITATATIYVGGQAALASPASSVKSTGSLGVPSSSSSEGSCAAGSSAPASSGWSNPFSSASGSPCVYIPTPDPSTATTPPPPSPSHSVDPEIPPAKPAVPVADTPAYTG